jgi:hypothetical protein
VGFFIIPDYIPFHDYDSHIMWLFNKNWIVAPTFSLFIFIILGKTPMNGNRMESYGLLTIYIIVSFKGEWLSIFVSFN